MSDFSRFRTSLNGFNRSDVTEYIESTSLEHQKEIRKLNDEIAHLRGENDVLADKLRAAQLSLADARLEAEALKQAEQDRLAALEAEAAAAEEAEEAEVPEPQTDKEQPQEESLTEKELAAYRRAEAMERNAQLRAEKLGCRIDALCESARTRCAESGGEFSALREDMTALIDRLKETLADVQVIFDETENAFDELDMIPDE